MQESRFVPKIDEYLERLKNAFDALDRTQIEDVMNVLLKAYEDEKTIYIFGNGGSASTASHYVCDFNKGISEKKDKKFNFVCLNDNIPTMLAIANDYSYEEIFKKQLVGRLKPNDLVIAISGSGNSKNVIKAVEYAREMHIPPSSA